MFSELVHSVVDYGNQALLLVGLNTSQYAPDRRHPYGEPFARALFRSAHYSAPHFIEFFVSFGQERPDQLCVDGYVFEKALQGVRASMRVDGEKGLSFRMYVITKVCNLATLGVLFENGAACLGVVLAISGIGLRTFSSGEAIPWTT